MYICAHMCAAILCMGSTLSGGIATESVAELARRLQKGSRRQSRLELYLFWVLEGMDWLSKVRILDAVGQATMLCSNSVIGGESAGVLGADFPPGGRAASTC